MGNGLRVDMGPLLRQLQLFNGGALPVDIDDWRQLRDSRSSAS